MKIYAQQVPPEYQESPLFNSMEWPENVFVFGNRYFIQHAERLEEIRAALEEIAAVWADLNDGGHEFYENWTDALNDVLPADGGHEYTRPERLELAKLAAQYEWRSSDAENGILCRVLELITGRDWKYGTLRGCCQGDWQEVIYPAEYGREWLERFEAEYFNTGTEWRINEGEPDGDDNYYFYAHGWNYDMIRAEIAAAAGCVPSDVTLYEFDGWNRTPKYRAVTA